MEKLIVEKPIDLKSFISKSLNISKTKSKNLIDTKNIFVNGKRVWIATYKLQKGDIVEIPEIKKEINKTPKISQNNILYEDDFIIAIDKPAFIVSESKKDSVEDQLRKLKGKNIKAIHRLDKETTGILLFAKSFSIFERFKKLWEEKNIKKEYIAISHKKAEFKKKIINFPIDNKYAKSEVFTVKTNKFYSLFKINIKTGRKHQIRIHLSKIGHPIIGDKDYGYKYIDDPILKSVKRQLLHSSTLSFFHPYLKKKVIINSPIPKDFKEFLRKVNLL